MDYRRVGRVFLLAGVAALLIVPAAWRTGVGAGECGDLQKVVNTGECVSGPSGEIIVNKAGKLLDLSRCANYHGRKLDERSFHGSNPSSNAPFDVSRDYDADLDGDGNPDIAVVFDDGTVVSDTSSGTQIDFIRAVKKFFITHPEEFTILHIFPNFNHAEGSFYSGVKNGIRGIGETIIDDSATFGTSRLEGFANFRNFVNYPADVHERIPGNNDSTMTLVAHETAHRWGASIKFDSDPSSRVKVSSALLGRGMAHWCYFANLSSTFNASTSSSLEGNGWADLGTGIFQTTNAQGTGGYSEIDQYLMGFRLPTEVGSTFVIDEDRSVTQSCSDKPYTPEIDGPSPITVTGSRLDLSVDDIIRVEGQRIPDASQSPRKIRMAFMLLTRDVPTVPSGDIAKLNGIRQEFTSYFLQESDNRGEAVTALGPVDMDGDGVDSLTDCNDLDPLVNPDAIEGPAFQESCNMIDDDCDGFVDEGFDADGDLWTTCNGDCDDTNADVSPDGIEVIGDLVDNDCDTLIDNSVPLDQDFDGWSPPRDCNDADVDISPDGVELVDGIDNNCNGFIDCADPTVQTQSEKGPRRTDGFDNNCNDIIDG
jgi:hypothetical protein